MTGFDTGESASGRVSSDLTGARKEGSNGDGGYILREKFGYPPTRCVAKGKMPAATV
jgi:hypothetical protein